MRTVLGALVICFLCICSAHAGSVSIEVNGGGEVRGLAVAADNVKATANAAITPEPGEEETAGEVTYAWEAWGDIVIDGATDQPSVTAKANAKAAGIYVGELICTVTQSFTAEDGSVSTATDISFCNVTIKLYHAAIDGPDELVFTCNGI